MPASCWSVSFCVCACAPRPIGHLGDAVFSCQLLVLSRKKKKERIQKPSAFSCQFSVIRGNKDVYRRFSRLVVSWYARWKRKRICHRGTEGTEKKPIQAKKGSPPGALHLYPLLPLQMVTAMLMVAPSGCVAVSAALANRA